MTNQAKAIDVVDAVVYSDTVQTIDDLFARWEGDDEAAMSIYLSLKVVIKTIEDELGIQPVEVVIE
ncbi:hypothetical protein Roomu2_00068 [Pseudomonas phage vB_PpuM-Roomu-2]|uniref:Uncharacterized protein n=1 Tax=Pseudomonas phage vB_PpuM-Roomu-2 TaxID=3132621 RepID=A0AAX4MYH0_9CAUD